MSAERRREVVIVGGGPAGLAAAIEAARSGLAVTVVDERPSVGGQIFRRPLQGFDERPSGRGDHHRTVGASLIAEARASGAEILCDTVTWGLWGRKIATYREPSESGLLEAEQLILATGAYDRPLVFPGWTLPGVMTAGGIHTLVKTQRISPGQRILVAGSGPLLLYFGADLAAYGAPVVQVLEAGPRPRLRDIGRLVRASRGNVATLRDGISYMVELGRRGVPLRYSHIVLRAEGDRRVERAVIGRVDRSWRRVAGSEETVEVDTIALGYGLVPSIELALLTGCDFAFEENLGGHVPIRDEWMRTTAAGVFSVGDGSGVSGSEAAMAEGRIAGIAAGLEMGRVTADDAQRRAAPHRARLVQLRQLRSALEKIYPVGPGIYELATPETIVCRCEEVTAAELLGDRYGASDDPNALKAITRAGMGGCQGKQCGRQIAALLAQRAQIDLAAVPLFTPRVPVRPVRIGAIALDRPDDAQVDVTG